MIFFHPDPFENSFALHNTSATQSEHESRIEQTTPKKAQVPENERVAVVSGHTRWSSLMLSAVDASLALPTILLLAGQGNSSRRVEALLTGHGYRTSLVHTPAAAKRLIEQNRVSLLLLIESEASLDLAQATAQNIPRILISENEPRTHEERERVSSVDDWLVERSVEAELLPRVASVLRRSRSASSAGTPVVKQATDSEMLPLIVHDLRTPLNVVSLTMVIMRHAPRPLEPELEKDLRVLEANFLQLERMLSIVADYSRLADPSLTLNHFAFNPRTFIEESIAKQAAKMGTSQSPVVVEVENSCPAVVKLDQPRVDMAIGYALANASLASNGLPVRLVMRGVGDRWVIELAVNQPVPSSVKSVALSSGHFERVCGVEAECTGMDLAIVARVSEMLGGTAQSRRLAAEWIGDRSRLADTVHCRRSGFMMPPLRLKQAMNLGGMHVRELAVRTWKKVDENELMTRAAAISFYAMLALVPFLGLVLTMAVQLLPDLTGQNSRASAIGTLTADELDATLESGFPREAYLVVHDQIARLQSIGRPSFPVLVLGIGVTIWLASSVFLAIIDAMNRISGVTETRSFIKVRLTAIVMTCIQALILLGSLLAIVLWPQVVDWMGLSRPTTVLLTTVQWMVVSLMVLMSFALSFFVGPDAEQSWEWITPGSLLGTLVFLLASFGFRVYVQEFSNYNKTYGSLGGVMVLLFWFWISSLVLLTSAQVNQLIEEASPLGKAFGQRTDITKPPELGDLAPDAASR